MQLDTHDVGQDRQPFLPERKLSHTLDAGGRSGGDAHLSLVVSIALRLSVSFGYADSMHPLRPFLILMMVVVLCQPFWPADSGLALADFAKSVTEFPLANGTKFIIVERHRLPADGLDRT